MIDVVARPNLAGPRVTLRAPVAADVDARFALGNSVEIQQMFGADPSQVRDITTEAAEAWVNNLANDPLAWMVEAEEQLLGSIRLHTVNHADLRANIAVGLLINDVLGRGYGTEAMRVLADYAFGDMGLHRLSCRVLAFNTRAIAAYKKVGFVEEGREREAARIGDAWHDDVVLGLLASDLRDGG